MPYVHIFSQGTGKQQQYFTKYVGANLHPGCKVTWAVSSPFNPRRRITHSMVQKYPKTELRSESSKKKKSVIKVSIQIRGLHTNQQVRWSCQNTNWVTVPQKSTSTWGRYTCKQCLPSSSWARSLHSYQFSSSYLRLLMAFLADLGLKPKMSLFLKAAMLLLKQRCSQNWMMGQRALSASLQTMQNLEEWFIYQMVTLSFRCI